MYTFKKTSWHVRFYKWLFDKDPTRIYKSMCPYFWTYVFIMLTLPFILLIKMIGKKGDQFLAWAEERRRNKKEKLIEAFKARCTSPNLSSKEAYEIKNSTCWDKFSWCLTWEEERLIRNLSSEYKSFLIQQKFESTKKRKETIQQYKENKTLNFIFMLIGGVLMIGILFIGIYALTLICWSCIDWIKILLFLAIVLLGVLGIIGVAYLIYVIVNGIKYLVYKVSCMNIKCPICSIIPNIFMYVGTGFRNSFPYISLPFVFLFKGVVIVLDMIYNTYKKNCPIIKWEE
jgi:hypothetical protein